MWWQRPFTAIDTETTGLNWNEDRVIQIGLSYFSDGQYLGGHAEIIDSGHPSCQEAIDTHHITDEMQRLLGVRPTDIFPLIRQNLMHPGFLVIMNAPFDLNFLLAELDRMAYNPIEIGHVIDPLVIDRFYSKNRIPSLARGKRTLKAMSERYGINDYPLHDAGHDSRRVGELAIRMAQNHGQLGRTPLSELMKKQRTWHKQWSDDFAGFADAKGFFFNRTTWPHERYQWQQENLTLPLPGSQATKVRRALPRELKDSLS